jgi:hypothetical protein
LESLEGQAAEDFRKRATGNRQLATGNGQTGTADFGRVLDFGGYSVLLSATSRFGLKRSRVLEARPDSTGRREPGRSDFPGRKRMNSRSVLISSGPEESVLIFLLGSL